MTVNLKKVLQLAETWSEEDREELAQLALEIEARHRGVYHATPEELKDIDEALAELARGELASEKEVEAIFAKYR